MPTIKKRLNITLPPNMERAIKELANRDGLPQATKASQLLEVALEIEEDYTWNAIAQKRDSDSSKFTSHEQAWR